MGFSKVISPDAKGITSTANNFIEVLEIDFGKIRGQGYDGASVMSGIHAGVKNLDSGSKFISSALRLLWLS